MYKFTTKWEINKCFSNVFFVFNASTASQLWLEMAEWVGGFVQVNKGLRQKIQIISLQRHKLKPFKYIFLPADSPVELTEFFFFSWRKTFIKVKAPFAGHPAASSAWLPAVTLSLLGGLESHCNKETQWHLVKNTCRTLRFVTRKHIDGRQSIKMVQFPKQQIKKGMNVLTGICCSL